MFVLGLHGQAQEPILGDYWAHDPTTMIKDGNRYYVYRTSEGIMAKWSTDRVNWVYGGQVFPSGPPSWVTNAVPNFENNFFWAPDIAYFNGKYHLYYSCSSWGVQVSAIGLVTSPSLVSPTWTDQGPVIQSGVGDAYNCIDPSVFLDTDGRLWMTFGSYWNGIYLTELDPATGKRVTPATVTRLAWNEQIEASCLFKRGSYYYLFVNHGSCCSGIDSTYHILVGRSTSVTGPYRDRDGNSMVSRGGTVFMEGTGRYIGPGHAGIMVEGSTNWLTYHYYDGNNNGVATLGLARLYWTDDDWPVVTNDWSTFYTFEEDAREHLGQFDGTLQNGAVVVQEPGRSAVLSLDGTDDYVDLPLSVANARTFAAWAKWNGGGTWQRIFDFGDGTSRYFFLSPRASSGTLRFAITTSGNGAEQIIDAPTSFPTGSWNHVAVTVEPGRGVMYLNGQPVGTNNSMTLRPWQVLARDNYIGESQWAADPVFDGLIDSFRVFARALEPAEIQALAFAHPSLAHRYNFAADATDSIGTAHGSLMGNASVTNGALELTGVAGGYVNLPGGLVSGCATVTLEFWATFGANGDWARVFDFGNSLGGDGVNFLFFSPHTGLNSHRLSMHTSGGGSDLDLLGTLDGQTVHVVCIVDPVTSYRAIYTNGVLAQQQTVALPALSTVDSALAYIGRSLFSADAWLNATIDDFRIYDGRLTPADIAANDTHGADALAIPVQLTVTESSNSVTLSWPSYAVGFVLESTAALGPGAIWTPVAGAPTLVGDSYQLTLPTTGEVQLFRLRR